MPMPVSATLISMCEFTRSSSTCTLPPLGVNLIAFESRFQTTCCSRLGSPEIGPAPGSSSFSSRMPFASAAGRTVSIAASTKATGSTGWMSRRTLPDVMRLMSSRSSISWVCTRALRSIVSSPLCSSASLLGAAPQDLRPAEDRAQRRAQLVRETWPGTRPSSRSCARPRRARRARSRAARLRSSAAFCAAS